MYSLKTRALRAGLGQLAVRGLRKLERGLVRKDPRILLDGDLVVTADRQDYEIPRSRCLM